VNVVTDADWEKVLNAVCGELRVVVTNTHTEQTEEYDDQEYVMVSRLFGDVTVSFVELTYNFTTQELSDWLHFDPIMEESLVLDFAELITKSEYCLAYVADKNRFMSRFLSTFLARAYEGYRNIQ